jgi:hypothetical protein
MSFLDEIESVLTNAPKSSFLDEIDATPEPAQRKSASFLNEIDEVSGQKRRAGLAAITAQNPEATGAERAEIYKAQTEKQPLAFTGLASGVKPPTERSLVGEFGSQLYAGGAIDVPEQAGNIAKVIAPKGSAVYRWGEQRKREAEAMKQFDPGFAPSINPEERPLAAGLVSQGARMVAPSMGLASAIGLAAPAIGIGAGAATVAGGLAGGASFGLSQGQDTYERGIAAGLSPEEARVAAVKEGAIEGVGESVGEMLGPAKWALRGGRPLRQAAAKLIKDLATKQGVKEVAKKAALDYVKTLGAETLTEEGQQIGERLVDITSGIDKTPITKDEILQTALATIGMTTIMAPLGLAGHVQQAQANNRISKILTDGAADPAIRTKAAESVFEALKSENPQAAANFALNAEQSISAGKPMVLDGVALERPATGKTAQPINPEVAAQDNLDYTMGPTAEQQLADPTRFEQGKEQAAGYLRDQAAMMEAGQRPDDAAFLTAAAEAIEEAETPEQYLAERDALVQELQKRGIGERLLTDEEKYGPKSSAVDQQVAEGRKQEQGLVNVLAQTAIKRAQVPGQSAIDAARGDKNADEINKAKLENILTVPATSTQTTITPSGDLKPESSPGPILQQQRPIGVTQNAINQGQQSVGDNGQHQGITAGAAVPASQEQVRQEEGEQTGGGDRVERGAEIGQGVGERVIKHTPKGDLEQKEILKGALNKEDIGTYLLGDKSDSYDVRELAERVAKGEVTRQFAIDKVKLDWKLARGKADVTAEPAQYRVPKEQVGKEVARQRADIQYKINMAQNGMDAARVNKVMAPDVKAAFIAKQGTEVARLEKQKSEMTPAAVEAELFAEQEKKNTTKVSAKIAAGKRRANLHGTDYDFYQQVADIGIKLTDAWSREEWNEVVPPGLLKKNGQTPDEVAAHFGMTSEELKEKLRNLPTLDELRAKKKSEDEAVEHIEHEGRQRDKWNENQKDLSQAGVGDKVRAGDLISGDTFRVKGKKITVADGERGLQFDDGEVVVLELPYEGMTGDELVYIDKDSLKNAEAARARDASGQLIPEKEMPFNLVAEREVSEEELARRDRAEAKRVEEAKAKKLEEMAQPLPGVEVVAGQFPSLLEFAKSRAPKSIADQMKSESQAESFRAQWNKERKAQGFPELSGKSAVAKLPAPVSKRKEKAKSAEPVVASLSPEKAVEQGQPVKLPLGTIRVKATYADGRTATVNVGDIETLAGTGTIKKLTPLQGKDALVPGEITVKKAKMPAKASERKEVKPEVPVTEKPKIPPARSVEAITPVDLRSGEEQYNEAKKLSDTENTIRVEFGGAATQALRREYKESNIQSNAERLKLAEHRMEELRREQAKTIEPQTEAVVSGENADAEAQIADFGEKIGGARKDTAVKTGPKAEVAKLDSDVPAWRRQYKVWEQEKRSYMNRVMDKPGEKTGKWVIARVHGNQIISESSQVFDTKEEAEKIVPLYAVSQNHRVYTERSRPATREEIKEGEKTADAIIANADKITVLRDSENGLLFKVDRQKQLFSKLNSGELSQDQYDSIVRSLGGPFSEDQVKKAQEIKKEVDRLIAEPVSVKEDTGITYAIRRILSNKRAPVVKGGFKTREDAMKYMSEHAEEIITHQFAFPEKPWLDKIERLGKDRRDGKNVTPKMFQDTFGFRGGEFGNWNMGGDGQVALNHAYDALFDLADALNISPKAVSLNGGLAIAFGARGHGGKESARAHYEPDKAVINLTKIRGAGSLAHEWFHALDNYLGQMGEQSTIAEDKAMLGAAIRGRVVERDVAGRMATEGLRADSKLRVELREVFNRVVKVMTGKMVVRQVAGDMAEKQRDRMKDGLRSTIKTIRDGFTYDLTQYKKNAKKVTSEQLVEFDRLAEDIAAGKVGEKVFIEGSKLNRFGGFESFQIIRKLNDLYKSVQGRSFDRADQNSYGRQLFWQIKSLQDAEKRVAQAKSGATEEKLEATDFLKEAKRIDSFRASDYWSTPVEMGARAFESFIYDKLQGQNERSDYLASGVENKFYDLFDMEPYPEGVERKAINDAFIDLFKTVKTRETEKGVAMYSLANVKPWPEGFPDAVIQTTRTNITKNYAKDFDAAKAGDTRAANRVVQAVVKNDKIAEIGRKYPNAILVPVHEEEITGKNKLPIAYAKAIEKLTGLDVDVGIVQTERVFHRGKIAIERILRHANFEGHVVSGQEYIIVDDHITQGGIIAELRHYIENNGGEIVAVTSLTASLDSTTIAIRKETIGELERKFGREQFQSIIREHDIAGTTQALTESQGKYLLSFNSLDAIRNRIAEARQEGSFSLAGRTLTDLSSQEITPEGVSPSDLLARGVVTSAMTRAEVIDSVNAVADMVGPVNVLQSESEIPAPVLAEAKAKGYAGRIEGFEYQGQTYLVADNMKDERHAQARALHEAFHAGFEKAFTGEQRGKILTATLTKFGRMMELAAIARKYDLNLADEADYGRAMNELIAKITQERTSKPAVWARFVGAIRQALRDMGVLKTLSDADMDYLIERALTARGQGGETRFSLAEDSLSSLHDHVQAGRLDVGVETAARDVAEKAKKMGVELAIEYVDKVNTTSLLNPKVKEQLLSEGYTNEELERLNASGHVYYIYGEYGPLRRGDQVAGSETRNRNTSRDELDAGRTGQPGDEQKTTEWKITLYRGLTPNTVYHEFTHIADKVAGRTATEQRAKELSGRMERGEDVRFSLADQSPVWYSRLERAIAGVKMPRLSLDQLAAATKQNVDSEERQWTGFDEWIEEKRKAGVKSVTKDEALEFVRENAVQVQEVVKGDNLLPEGMTVEKINPDDPYSPYQVFDNNGKRAFNSIGATREEAVRSYNASSQKTPKINTKFAQYQTPGDNNNYREVLLTLPTELPVVLPDGWVALENLKMPINSGTRWAVVDKSKSQHEGKGWGPTREEAVKDALVGQGGSWRGKEYGNKTLGLFTSSHWSEPNVLAHVRMNDRVDVDGKKVLFIEEIQSDWHQKGREDGYVLPPIVALPDGYTIKSTPVPDGTVYHVVDEEGRVAQYRQSWGMINSVSGGRTREDALKQYLHEVNKSRRESGVPNAPFKSSWPMLAMKRMIRYAAENGYDRIAWTTGEMQAERYDLSKHISELAYWKEDAGTWGVSLLDIDGKSIDSWNPKEGMDEKELEAQIGKDLSRKIIQDEGTAEPETSEFLRKNGKLEKGVKVIQGEGLKVGGEGMKAFYDRILPNEVNKFVKKWGGRVGQSKLTLGSRKTQLQVPSLDITPAMRESVMTEGVPMFSLADKIVTTKQDAAYLDAVKRGDMETAQKMVDEVAKRAGYNVGPVWHGTHDKRLKNIFPEWSFFSSSQENATSYATYYRVSEKKKGSPPKKSQRIISAFLKTGHTLDWVKNPPPKSEFSPHYYGYDQTQQSDFLAKTMGVSIDVLEKADPSKELYGRVDRFPLTQRMFSVLQGHPIDIGGESLLGGQYAETVADDVRVLLKRLGYDSVRFYDQIQGNRLTQKLNALVQTWVVSDPSQIKSAEPVTRDSAGNTIPLSERFNPSEKDIRYSLADQESPGAKKLPDDYTAFLMQKVDEILPLADRAATTGYVFGKAEGKANVQERIKKTGEKLRSKFAERMEQVRKAAEEKREHAVLAARMGERAKGRKEAIKEGIAIGFRQGEESAVTESIEQGAKLAFAEIARERKTRYFDTLRDISSQLDAIESNLVNRDVHGNETGRKTPEQIEEMQKWGLARLFGQDRYNELLCRRRRDMGSVIMAVRDVLRKELSGYYVREVEKLLMKTKPDRMLPEFRDTWNEKVAELSPEELTRKNWEKAKELWEELNEIIADNRGKVQFLGTARRQDAQAAGELAAVLLNESMPAIKGIEKATPARRGRMKYLLGDKAGNAQTRALTLADGSEKETAVEILYDNLRQADTAARSFEVETIRPVTDMLKAQGISDGQLIDMKTRLREYKIGGQTVVLNDAEKIELAAAWQDPETKLHIALAGFMPKRRTGQPSARILGDSPSQMADIVEDIIKTLTPEQKALVDKMVDQLTGMAKEANKVSVIRDGWEKFTKSRYWPRRVERSTTQQTIDLGDGYTSRVHNQQSLNALGFTKARQEHTHPVLIGDAFETFFEHAHMMSKYAKLLLATHDALTLIGNPMFSESVRTRLGSHFLYDTRDMITRLSGLRGYKSDSPGKRVLDALTRNVAVSILWWRPTSIIFNRWGGSFLAASELWHRNPSAAGRFLTMTFLPVSLHTKDGKEIVEKLMQNGYLWDRWSHDMAHVYSPLPSERAGETSNTKLKMNWRKMQEWGLRPMANAEMRNMVAAFKALKAAKYTDAEAVQACEEITRATQNPSSALEESALYADIKERSLGWMFPFIGQPMASRNLIARDFLTLHHAKNGKDKAGVRRSRVMLAASVFGLVANIGLELSVRGIFRALSRRPPDDDDEASKAVLRNVSDAASSVMDFVLPGSGRLADMMISAFSGKQPREMSSIFGGIHRDFFGGLRKLLNPYDKDDDFDEEKLLAGIGSLLDASASALGGPVGGPEVAFRILKNQIKTEE